MAPAALPAAVSPNMNPTNEATRASLDTSVWTNRGSTGHIILAAVTPETIAGRVVAARRVELGECCDDGCCEE